MRAGNLYSTNTGNNSSLVATASVWNLVRSTRCPRIFLITFLFASTWFCAMGVIFNHWNTSRLKYHSVYSSHLPFCLRPHATSGSTYSACLNLKEDRGDPADRDNGSTSAAVMWGQNVHFKQRFLRMTSKSVTVFHRQSESKPSFTNDGSRNEKENDAMLFFWRSIIKDPLSENYGVSSFWRSNV